MKGIDVGFVSPPPPYDIGAIIPELQSYAATTVRLRPRRGNPGVSESSVSRPLLWPADEPWPWCTESSEHERPNAYQPLLQVFARDAPTMFFPEGSDLLQLLWCPNERCSPAGPALAGCPRPLARWRRSADVTDVLPAPPMPEVVFDEWFPCNPCVVSPESVVEYPYATDLPPELRHRIDDWEAAGEGKGERSYDDALSVVPGTKTGGHPSWGALLDPHWPDCVCGRRMSYLLTISDLETCGSGTRWDRDFPGGWQADTDGHDLALKNDLLAFACTICPGAPFDFLIT